MDLVLTCTYEGTRTVEGKKEAVINLLGEMNVLKTERPLMAQAERPRHRTAIFDVDKGHVSKLKMALSDERDYGGIIIARIFEADMTRVRATSTRSPRRPRRSRPRRRTRGRSSNLPHAARARYSEPRGSGFSIMILHA